jgi:CRP-like cAMP-binding protein
MGIRDEFPYCKDIIESNYSPLLSSSARTALYVRTNNDRFVFENPLHGGRTQKKVHHSKRQSISANHMSTKDFLATISAFADFTDQQLRIMEDKATVELFALDEIIFKQGEDGDKFYVIKKGSVDVLIQDNANLLRKGDLGKIVNRLNEACYFGERALMRSEPRAASIRANQDTTCLVFSRGVYEEVISGSNALIGQNTAADVDWSKDHETRSLFKHIENILEIDKTNASPKIKRILYELSTAFTPELLPDEIIARMVMTVKVALRVDRVGLFVLSEDKRSMILKVSERSKGVRLPIRGLAGAVLQTNVAINIPDAYQDQRFDATMDRRTGYRTRQVLSVPLRHPLSGEAMGVLQVNNKLDKDPDAFSSEQQKVLELAAQQLSELLLGRADVFIHAGSENSQRSFGQGVGDGLVLLNSAEISTPFQMDVFAITIGLKGADIILRESIIVLEIQVSLHLALTLLCPPQNISIDAIPKIGSNAVGKKGSVDLSDIHFSVRERITFEINVRDVPRAARILFKIIGYKKKKVSGSSSSSNPKTFIGWAACTVFDFKGCLDSVQELNLFLGGDREVEVPITTTLNNENDRTVATLSAVLAPDIVLAADTGTPRVRIVHSMPKRVEPFVSDQQNVATINDAVNCELDRILKLSFNPMSLSIVTEKEKEFLWNLRYTIFHRANLLPAFVMCIHWNRCEQVQELYELLDLWEPASPVEALQLLDRRFMDPKVRAYAVHCLEELSDDELALYMLQLCQQLKFENFVDSALARFLLRRALTNQKLIGHIYFWLLQSEVYNSDVSKRYIILLQVFNYFSPLYQTNNCACFTTGLHSKLR